MHQIGVGVLGPLFRATDASGSVVAVKAFRLDLTPEQAERFADALRDVIAVGLSDPSIVPLLDAGIDRGVPYFVSECVAGSSLDVMLRSASGQPVPAAETVARITEAVDAAHARGVMHGTLHLRDVIVDGDAVRVSGFGVANVLEHVGLRIPIRRPYAAPELVAGRHWGPEADRFAVAAIAYELLTGVRAAGSRDDVLVRLRDLAGVNVVDPAGLQQAFRNALADDPSLRPASAGQFLTAFAGALGTEGPMSVGVDLPIEEPSPVEPSVEGPPPVEPFAGEPPPVEQASAGEPSPVEPSVVSSTVESSTVESSEEDAFELVAEPAGFESPGLEGDALTIDDPHLAPEAAQTDVAAAPREPEPPGRRLIARSAAPVAIALVAGIGIALALGLELSGPAEAPPDTSPDLAPVSDPAPAPVAGFEVQPQPRPAPREATPPPQPVDDAPAVADSLPVPEADPPPAPPSSPTGPGSVYADTRPPGAIVLIDGERVGVTPLLVPDLAAGAHEVRFELPGYLPWATEVAVTSEEQLRVGATLQPDGSR